MEAPRYEIITLIKPGDALGEVKEIYEDIVRTKGSRWLTPYWGFFAHRPKILKLWWELTKTLQIEEGKVPKSLMEGISLVCAVGVGCPRCINNHQIVLIEKFGFSEERVEQIKNLEQSDLPEKEKVALIFAKKVAFGQELDDEEFTKMRELGYGDEEIVEIVSMAIIESGAARHGAILARFEDVLEWPPHNTPSEFYSKYVPNKGK
jgi:alkylhydroperoxidase family enzyme